MENEKIAMAYCSNENDLEQAFLAVWDAAMKERDEEMIRFAEWMGDVHSHKYGNLWYDNGDPNTVATTAELLEKFRSKSN